MFAYDIIIKRTIYIGMLSDYCEIFQHTDNILFYLLMYKLHKYTLFYSVAQWLLKCLNLLNMRDNEKMTESATQQVNCILKADTNLYKISRPTTAIFIPTLILISTHTFTEYITHTIPSFYEIIWWQILGSKNDSSKFTNF